MRIPSLLPCPFLVLLLICCCCCFLPSSANSNGHQKVRRQQLFRRDPISLASRWRQTRKFAELAATPQQYNWTEEWYHQMPVDHFAFTNNRTFSLRYLINTQHFLDFNAPIFFYTGNEGAIEGFAQNTGFMWDLAPEFGAAIVFAEHRFYGKSMPFGNASYANVSNLGYLTSEQALADFALLLTYLKAERLQYATRSPVIAFGGSYGGMLTAWMRVKYPHLVDGGIAASAPVFWFNNVPVPPEHSYDDIVTRTFLISGCTLESLVASREAIRELAKSATGRRFLNENFHLAPESQVHSAENGEQLLGSIKDVMETMTMVDYPYATDFLAPLPAWPVRQACKAYVTARGGEQQAMASYQMLNMFYNSTGTLDTLCLWGDKCPGPFSELGDPDGWPWQACTEMVMPMCSRGVPNDPFNATCPYNISDSLAYCLGHFGRIGFQPGMFRPRWTITNYGAEFPSASNVVFSNGWLDPWSGGGWRLQPTQRGSLVSLIVEDGAHHYDLRGAHPADTDAVKEVRRLEKMHIQRWIDEARQRHRDEKKAAKERLLRAELLQGGGGGDGSSKRIKKIPNQVDYANP